MYLMAQTYKPKQVKGHIHSWNLTSSQNYSFEASVMAFATETIYIYVVRVVYFVQSQSAKK